MPFEGIKPATVLRLPQIGSKVPVPVVPADPPAPVVTGVVVPPAPVVAGVVVPPAPVVTGVVAPPFEGATVAPPVLVTPPVLSVVTGE
jgi:hypothetical protein